MHKQSEPSLVVYGSILRDGLALWCDVMLQLLHLTKAKPENKRRAAAAADGEEDEVPPATTNPAPIGLISTVL